ncbi:putative glycoprotein-N-acetylgalactosamine 3-beta-galactosyltransferase activity [Lyophyllum shimeji]|uniref:Glycoprotein-N-acetylgalactosamine 3-beta-galactosyltransferase activity n=1 Tax=Lyophyllum shimeji TaxID=47721 RepID=A0A9P3PYJ5_LYOSH|nr:putative glycoprotein-N-acetylgalactosamine 3-beta-galactosyltransferase activity [Lyophyllum shimeji]
MVHAGAISWSSKKQELVTLAEYVAATHAAKEMWLHRLIEELFRPLNQSTTLYSDSQSAIALTKDGHYHARTKHINIRYHYICYIIEAGSIELIYCPTNDMTADTLTKALPSTKAKHFAAALDSRRFEGSVGERHPVASCMLVLTGPLEVRTISVSFTESVSRLCYLIYFSMYTRRVTSVRSTLAELTYVQ